jgi:hypothetical protein
MSSAQFYQFAIEEYSDIAGNSATCYVHFDRSACRQLGEAQKDSLLLLMI